MIDSKCHLIVVVGGKGGIGKSVFAANFATAITKELKQHTLLIDADALSCGDQNFILGTMSKRTLGELAKFNGKINAQTIPSLVTKHASGIFYVGAVKSKDETLSVDPNLIARPIGSLSTMFKYIVVDIGSTLSELQQVFLKHASLILTVTGSDSLAVNQTSRLLGDFAAATVPGDLVGVVANRVSVNSLSPQQIQSSLKKNILGFVEQDDKLCATALQRGMPFVALNPQAKISASYHNLVRKVTSGNFLTKLKSLNKGVSNIKSKATLEGKAESTTRDSNTENNPRNLLKIRLHQELIQAMDLRKSETDTKGDPEKEKALRRKVQQMVSTLVDKELKGGARDERSRLIKEILDESLGLGPLEDLLEDETVTEVMVNSHSQLFVEKSGRLSLSDTTFTSNFHLRKVIERIVTPLGRRIDETSPYVDARLKDGSRVNAVIEPIAIDGPSLTIRKFSKKPVTINNYIEWGSITQPMIDFLKICVENGLNLLISGGTGSGKTTLLNTLSGFIPARERIITVEDAAELQLKQTHVVRLETRPANLEGSGSVTIRDLIMNSLRMRPDRIIVGECRGGEALDMLQAMNTGHDGSMTTVHANNPVEAVSRVETLCLMAGMELPAKAIRKQIANAVNLIVQISRMSDGSRKIKSVTEVCGMSGDNVTLTEIFKFKEEGFDKNRKIIGQFQALGRIPTFIEDFEKKGVKIPRTLFTGTGTKTQKPQATPTKVAKPTVKKAS